MKNTQAKRPLKVPHVYILLLGMILFFAILSYIVPAGQYDMITVDDREIIDSTSFRHIEQTPVSPMNFLTALPRGLIESAQIIFFIFIVGGSFAVLNQTKSIEAAMGKLITAMKEKTILIIPMVMIAFSLLGAVFGMAEETIPFIPIFVSLFIAMGYDSITGAAIVFVGACTGFAAAFINPFTVQVAQGIAGLPILSGMPFRIVMYVVMTGLAIVMVMRYAKKVKQDPTLSPMYETDSMRKDVMKLEDLEELTTTRKVVLLVFLATIVLLILGVVQWGWYMNEIAALFLGMSFVVAIVSRMGFNNYANALSDGMTDIASGALVVGFARGILVVMIDGNILHTILYAAANFLGQFPSAISAAGMYVFQCLLNVLVPSGSGQAAISIPIMAPLGDLVGVTRQTAVIAFQLGDGLSNIITPTSGYFMAGLALAKIPWEKWAKWFIKIVAVLYLVGLIFVLIAQFMKLGPF